MENYSDDEFDGKPKSLGDIFDLRDKENINDPYEGIFCPQKKYIEEVFEMPKEDNENKYFMNAGKELYQTEKPMSLENVFGLNKDKLNDSFNIIFCPEKKYIEEDFEITEDNENKYFISASKELYQTENNNTPNTKSTSFVTNINLVKKDKNANLNTPLEVSDYSKVIKQLIIESEAAFSTNQIKDEESCEIREKDNINKNLITKTSPNAKINLVQKDQNTNETSEKRKIFDISKVNKKVGRMLKKLKNKFKAAHNKYSEDNIIRKFKARFQDILLRYINHEYSKFMETKGKSKKTKLLQRINPEESRKISKADNKRWFSTKLKVLFSSDLSQKCSLYDSNYNRRTIEKIYKNNEALNVISILDKEVFEMYDLYRKNIKIDGFATLEDDLKMLREKMKKENEEKEEDIKLYLSKYRNIAMRLDKIFEEKKGRNKKKAKKIKA